MYDFGMAMISMCLFREDVMMEIFHTDKPTSLRFWHAFLKAYFGTDCRIDEIEEAIRPFAAIRALYMQSMEGQIIPPFQKWVLDALAKGSFEA